MKKMDLTYILEMESRYRAPMSEAEQIGYYKRLEILLDALEASPKRVTPRIREAISAMAEDFRRQAWTNLSHNSPSDMCRFERHIRAGGSAIGHIKFIREKYSLPHYRTVVRQKLNPTPAKAAMGTGKPQQPKVILRKAQEAK